MRFPSHRHTHKKSKQLLLFFIIIAIIACCANVEETLEIRRATNPCQHRSQLVDWFGVVRPTFVCDRKAPKGTASETVVSRQSFGQVCGIAIESGWPTHLFEDSADALPGSVCIVGRIFGEQLHEPHSAAGAARVHVRERSTTIDSELKLRKSRHHLSQQVHKDKRHNECKRAFARARNGGPRGTPDNTCAMKLSAREGRRTEGA